MAFYARMALTQTFNAHTRHCSVTSKQKAEAILGLAVLTEQHGHGSWSLQQSW